MAVRYSNQLAMDFWFDFDNFFLWKATSEVGALVSDLFTSPGGQPNEGWGYQLFRATMESGTFPKAFKTAVKPKKATITALFKLEQQLMKQHFGGNGKPMQLAFEAFGQGTLYDVRREVAVPYGFWPIHAMDADYANGQPPIGYYSWYSYMRAHTLLSSRSAAYWLQVARYMALAAAIQQRMQPRNIEGGVHSNPNNPPIPAAELATFRLKYLGMSFDQLDMAFVHDDALGPRPPAPRFS